MHSLWGPMNTQQQDLQVRLEIGNQLHLLRLQVLCISIIAIQANMCNVHVPYSSPIVTTQQWMQVFLSEQCFEIVQQIESLALACFQCHQAHL